VSVGELAIAWTLHRAGVSGAIVGGRSAEQVTGTIGAAAVRLSEDDMREIDAIEQETRA
jgi:aryl-alcohol dehydrogenase-like predicted oxidoreductase